MIANLESAVQLNTDEVKECKQKIKDLEKRNEQLCKEIGQLKEKVREQDKYLIRSCLHIQGLEEKKDEDIRGKIIQILGKVAPDMESKMEEAVDLVHRVGRKMLNKNRHVIILFAHQQVKEEIWHRSKCSSFCKDSGICFAELLPQEPCEDWIRLLPKMELVEQAGKLAFFWGPNGFIGKWRIDDDRFFVKTAMFNPSDLEGEVDHSFFDSDCDDGSLSRDGGKKLERDLEAIKDIPTANVRLQAEKNGYTKGARSPRMNGTLERLEPVEINGGSQSKRNENSCNLQEEEIGASSISSVACLSDEVNHKCYIKDEDDSNLNYKKPNGSFMALLAEARDIASSDMYSSNESEEEKSASNLKDNGTKGRNRQSHKKRVRKRCHQSLSHNSTEASVDADSESSRSSRNRCSSVDSTSLPRRKKSSVSTCGRKIRSGSEGSLDVSASHTEESDKTLTDVSSLSSDSVLLQSLDLKDTEAEEGGLIEQQKEGMSSSGPFNIHPDEDHDVDVYSLSSDSQLGGNLLFHDPGGRNRKNYSFTNDEVQSIDRENQRLLLQLSHLSCGSTTASTVRKKIRGVNYSPVIRQPHSAINRQREQKRIERDNLALLKRLESAKPTSGLKRSEQLADYQQNGTRGTPWYPYMTITKKGGSTSKTPTGARTAASSHLRHGAVSPTNDSTNTSATRTKMKIAARPAWC